MSLLVLDSSAVAKRYLVETGTSWMRSITDPGAGTTIILAEITLIEVSAALTARFRAGSISPAERDAAVRLLLQHADTEYQLVPIRRFIVDRAVSLTQSHRLRGYDAVQLAVALVVNERYLAAGLPALAFVAADDDLITAAHAEGLVADNPNRHP